MGPNGKNRTESARGIDRESLACSLCLVWRKFESQTRLQHRNPSRLQVELLPYTTLDKPQQAPQISLSRLPLQLRCQATRFVQSSLRRPLQSPPQRPLQRFDEGNEHEQQ